MGGKVTPIRVGGQTILVESQDDKLNAGDTITIKQSGGAKDVVLDYSQFIRKMEHLNIRIPANQPIGGLAGLFSRHAMQIGKWMAKPASIESAKQAVIDRAKNLHRLEDAHRDWDYKFAGQERDNKVTINVAVKADYSFDQRDIGVMMLLAENNYVFVRHPEDPNHRLLAISRSEFSKVEAQARRAGPEEDAYRANLRRQLVE